MTSERSRRVDHDCLPPRIEPTSPERWECADCGARWQLNAARQWERLTEWDWDGG